MSKQPSTPCDEDAPLRRVQCPECPDGQVWDNHGPTGHTCLTCGGDAFIWTTEQADE